MEFLPLKRRLFRNSYQFYLLLLYLKCGIYHLYILSSFVFKMYHIFLLFLFFASKSLVFPCVRFDPIGLWQGLPKITKSSSFGFPRTSPVWGRCNPETPKLGVADVHMDVNPKIGGFSPQIIHWKIGFSIIFTIHFGGFPTIWGNTHICIHIALLHVFHLR